MKWPIVPISDFCKIGSGGTPLRSKSDRYYGGHIPWIKSGELKKDVITETEEYITDAALVESSAKLIPSGAILVAMYGATVGQTSILGVEATTNQAICHILPDPQIAIPQFLWYVLRSKLSELLSRRFGGAQPNISQQIIKTTQISIPPLSEQRRIVEILDQADALRRMRAEADAKGDRILPALFIKMFGDPAKNPMGWDIVLVEKLFSRKRAGTKCGPFGSALKKHEYVDNGIPVWGIDNIKQNQFVESGSLFITPTKYEELKSYSVEPGDIIISRAGTVGRMCVARPQQSPSIISTNLIRLTLDKKDIFPEYFTSLLSYFPTSVNQLRASGDEGAYSFMNTTILKSLKIPLPPFDLQNKYTRCMAEIRKLNEKQIESQAKLNNLFQCLLYRGFSGELTAKWREAHMKELLAEMEEQAKALNLIDKGNYQQLTMLKNSY